MESHKERWKNLKCILLSEIHVCLWVLSGFSPFWLFVTLWTVLSGCSLCGILQARILEWVAFLSSRGSSRLRDRTRVSCIAGGFFTHWDTWDEPFWKGWILCDCSYMTFWKRQSCGDNTDISGCREGEREMNRQSSEDFGIAKILQWYHDSGYMSLCICSDSHQECCCTLDYSPV